MSDAGVSGSDTTQIGMAARRGLKVVDPERGLLFDMEVPCTCAISRWQHSFPIDDAATDVGGIDLQNSPRLAWHTKVLKERRFTETKLSRRLQGIGTGELTEDTGAGLGAALERCAVYRNESIAILVAEDPLEVV